MTSSRKNRLLAMCFLNISATISTTMINRIRMSLRFVIPIRHICVAFSSNQVPKLKKKKNWLQVLLDSVHTLELQNKSSPSPAMASKLQKAHFKLRDFFYDQHDLIFCQDKQCYYTHHNRAGQFLASHIKTQKKNNLKLPILSALLPKIPNIQRAHLQITPTPYI